MDDVQLRDEAVRDRIRAAEEFLDPRMSRRNGINTLTDNEQRILAREATRLRSCLCSTVACDD